MSSRPIDRPPSGHDIMGVELDLLSATELVGRVFGDLDDGRGGWIATPNVDIVRQCVRDPHLKALVGSATLSMVDGAPVEWAGKLAGQSMPGRVPGSAMPWLFGPVAAQRERAMLLVGGRPGAAELAAEALQRSFPGLRVGYHFPPFGFETQLSEWDALRRAIRDTQADIVFVGLGFPKQERVIRILREDFPNVWFVGCGAAIDFVAGIVPRAPEWMQNTGLEWAYRVMVEPRRLAKRYLIHDVPFAARMLSWALAQPRPVAESRRLAA